MCQIIPRISCNASNSLSQKFRFNPPKRSKIFHNLVVFMNYFTSSIRRKLKPYIEARWGWSSVTMVVFVYRGTKGMRTCCCGVIVEFQRCFIHEGDDGLMILSEEVVCK